MKFIRSIIPTLIVASALILAGCGSKNTTSTGTYTSSGIWSASGTSNISTIMSAVISQTDAQRPCTTGARLTTVHFPLSVYSNNTLVANQASATSYPSGTVYSFYIGISNFGDVMVVSKLGTSSFVASLSMCPYSTSLTSSRPLQALHTPYGVVIGDTTTSNMGTILAAKNTSLLLGASGNYSQVWFGPTTFYPVTIK